METTKTIVCRDCGRELPETMFKRTRWGTRSCVCNDCATSKCAKTKKERKDDENTKQRELRLKDFTPRELMEELARRGYEGKLTFTEVHEIDIAKF